MLHLAFEYCNIQRFFKSNTGCMFINALLLTVMLGDTEFVLTIVGYIVLILLKYNPSFATA